MLSHNVWMLKSGFSRFSSMTFISLRMNLSFSDSITISEGLDRIRSR